jgi:hypothetical protein
LAEQDEASDPHLRPLIATGPDLHVILWARNHRVYRAIVNEIERAGPRLQYPPNHHCRNPTQRKDSSARDSCVVKPKQQKGGAL